jgi:hypothetical protein
MFKTLKKQKFIFGNNSNQNKQQKQINKLSILIDNKISSTITR